MKKLGLLFCFLSLSLFAKEVPPLSGPVVDQVGVLDAGVRRALTSALVNLKKTTGNQLQLLVVDSLEEESIEGYAIKVVDKWKIGSSSLDNGVLFLLAMKERQVRIEVGQGLEGQLTDIITGRIIDLITPYFKKSDYSTGIVIGMNAIAATIGQELRANVVPRKNMAAKRPSRGAGFFVIIFILVFILGRGRRGGSGLGWFLLGTMSGGFGRGGGGSFGGGSSWGGGGGGFSGGGASGSW